MEKRWKEEEEGVVNYVIDNNGTNPIGDLPIGARVTDHSWEWEFRTDKDDSVSEDVKSVTWIVVAKNHYDGLEAHVTLLAVDLIGFYALDNSTNRGSDFGSNHWGESGTANATYGLRPWLNSTGTHEGEGFYRTFSDSFKEAVLETTLPNKEWKNGTAYSTQDHVFLPSTTELGYRWFSSHDQTYRIGNAYAYFSEVSDSKRVALFDGKPRWYWTRSPDSSNSYRVRDVYYDGKFDYGIADDSDYGVRPALNLKSKTLVSEIRN